MHAHTNTRTHTIYICVHAHTHTHTHTHRNQNKTATTHTTKNFFFKWTETKPIPTPIQCAKQNTSDTYLQNYATNKKILKPQPNRPKREDEGAESERQPTLTLHSPDENEDEWYHGRR